MTSSRTLAVLYDLTLAFGGESRVRPLLTTALQRLMFHTGLPVGLALQAEQPGAAQAVVTLAIGDRRLAALCGTTVPLGPGWCESDLAELRGDAAQFTVLTGVRAHGYALRLPLPGYGALVLLGPDAFASELPLVELLRPVLGNLGRALELCRANEAVLAARDSERKRVEAQARMLSLVVSQSPNPVIITDRDARIEYVNDAFERVTGYKRDEVLGQNPRILRSGKTAPAVYESMWAALAQGKTWQGELINRRKDGSEYVEQAIVSSILQSDGRVTHYLAITEDITERKRLEDELAQHRDHLDELVAQRSAELQAVFGAPPDLYFRVDRNGVALDCSSSGSRFLVPPESFLGRRLPDVMPPGVGAQLDQAMTRVAAGDRMVALQYDLDLPDGKQTYEARLLPLGTEGQQIIVVWNISSPRTGARSSDVV